MDAHYKTLKFAALCVVLLATGAFSAVRRSEPQLRQAGVARTSPQVRDSPSRPSRVISVIPAVTEMLFAMGAGPQVVAVGSYDHFPPAADKLPKVGALLDPDFEKILALRPDLVIVYGTQTDFIARLQKASIPIFPYEHAGLADITETIRKLGDRVGRTTEAEALASGMERELAGIRARAASQPKVRTLLVFGREAGALRGIYASGGVGFLHDLLVIAGGVDVFDELKKQSVVISGEQVLAKAPDAIIELYDQDTTDAKLAAERAVWKQLPAVPAVRNNRVHLLRGDFLTVPGPRIVEAARMLANALHPQ